MFKICILLLVHCMCNKYQMQHNFPYIQPCNTRTVPLSAYVSHVAHAINTGAMIPLGDYGGDTLYYFTTLGNGLGSIKYTVFDRNTHVGLASFLARFGAATTVRDLLFYQAGKTTIPLEYVILPKIEYNFLQPPGDVIPQ